jgi:predicted dehydrogenase
MIGVRGHNGYVLAGLERLPRVRLVGLSPGTDEDDVESLRLWAEGHGHTPEVIEDYRAMLDRLKPDVVSICGPLELHAQMCIDAFQRGIHVFCEKPVATTLEDLARLKAAYDEANVHAADAIKFAGMMGLRYAPAFYTAWQAVQRGAVGEVRLLNTRKSYKLGQRPPYYRDRETYGGTIPWVGSHAIDWIYWFSGVTFRSVYATHSTLYNREQGDLEVSALCHFTLANAVYASASLDYFRPVSAPTHGDDRVRVVGTEGVIEVQGGEVFLINEEAEGEQCLAPACDKQIFQDFVMHVAGETTALLDAQDTFIVTEACLLARQSADEGRIVKF